METIKYYFNLWINRYCDFLLNFLMNWLRHSPLKNINEAYLYFFAGTGAIFIFFVTVIFPLIFLYFLIKIIFTDGKTFKDKFHLYSEKWKIQTKKNIKEWPNRFGYKYLIQLNYITISFIIIFSIILKSFSFLFIGFPYIIMIFIHNNKIKKIFHYELYATNDLIIYAITCYITAYLLVHFIVNYSLK